jgi:hypothetical protein
MDIDKELLKEIYDKLIDTCELEFDRYSDRFYPTNGIWSDVPYEERMMKGDAHAWLLSKKIKKILEQNS